MFCRQMNKEPVRISDFFVVVVVVVFFFHPDQLIFVLFIQRKHEDSLQQGLHFDS